MTNTLLLICSILFLQIFLTFFYARISGELGLIDYPSKRKNHSGLIPLVGGITIFSSLLFFFIVYPTNFAHKIIFFSSLFIFFIGVLDDRYNLGIFERILFQIIACLIVIGFNIKIEDIGNYNSIIINLGSFGVLLSFLCIIGFTNAINFSDGSDGLASGYILNCLFSIIFFSFMNDELDSLEPLYFLSFIVIIFMFSNFGLFLPKTFLGDSGSTSLGFILACYLVYFTMPDNRHFHPILTFWAAPIPVLDFFSVFISRLLNNDNPFKPDRQHIHHLLLKTKINSNYITFTLVLSSIFLGFFGYATFFILGAIHSVLFFFFVFIIYYLFCFYLKKITI